MKPEDFIGPPCQCGECVQAGVSTLEQRRDPYSGKLLHGYALKRWYAAKAEFDTLMRETRAKVLR